MDHFGLSTIQVFKLAFLLTLAAGCVDLNKPKKVQECAARGNCANNPSQQQSPDAKQDTGPSGPDLRSEDKPITPADLGPDVPIPDAPIDQTAPDPKDATGTDGTKIDSSSDPDGGLPPADAEPDPGPDTNRQDGSPDLGPDLRPDLGPDSSPDLSPDTSTLVSGLLAYYKCEGATGTTLTDSSGKGNHGTLQVGAATDAGAGSTGYTFRAGKVGNALALAQAGQGYVSLPPAIFANTTDITIATWVNVTTSQNWQRVFDVGVNAKLTRNPATGTLYMNLVPKNAGTTLAFAISKDGFNNEQTLTAAALATNTWRHVAVVLSSGQGNLYLDGALVSGPSAISLRPTDLGAIDYANLGKSQFSADPYFDGQIDEFRVYGRALSATEIRELYQFAGP
jgi:hypothetical protein